MQAKKSAEGTTHAQLAAQAAETAEKVQAVQLQNDVKKEKEKEQAVESALQKDKAKLGKEEVELNAALRKDQRLEAANNAEKQNTAIMKDKLKDEKAQAKADREKARAEEKKAQDETNKAKEELAGAKAKAVATEAKDAIAEGQTKGQLTVVLGKLKANQATIDELRREIVELKKQKSGGEGMQLKAKLVEQQVEEAQQTASKELTRSRAKAKLLELKTQELNKRKNGYKARLV